MIAMTIFMGSAPAWALPASAGFQAVSLARSRAKSRFAQSYRCHESSAVPVRAIGRKCLETRSVCGAAATCLRPFAKRRTNPAQVCSIFNQEVRSTECHVPRIDARECLGGIGGARLERGHAQGANVLGRTADAGLRWLAAVTARALRLLQRFAVLGQIEAFDLVLLAHPQRQEESDRLEENVGQHAGPDEDCDDGVELDQHLPGIAL